MGSRSMGEWLLRPTATSRLCVSQTSPAARLVSPAWTARRTLTNSSPSNSAQPQLKEQEEETKGQASPTRPAQAPQAADPFSDLVSSTPRWRASSKGQRQTTDSINQLFAGTNDPRYSRTRTGYASRPANSSDEFGSALQKSQAKRAFGENFSPSRAGGARRAPGLTMSDMLGLDGLPDNMGPDTPKAAEVPEAEKIYPRLNASYGRMVELDETKGRDLVRGIGMLGSLMARNKVRADMIKQKFHERPGLKRKRLASERWRARFKKGFRDVTARVGELTRKGW